MIADEHAGLLRRQRCTVHLQRNVLAKVPHRLRKRVAREVAAVFRAPGLAESKKRLATARGSSGSDSKTSSTSRPSVDKLLPLTFTHNSGLDRGAMS